MRAAVIISILAAIISCTLAQLPPEFPPEVLLRNEKNYYPTSDRNFDSWINQAPVYKSISGSSQFSSSNRRCSRYGANPELRSYQLELPPEFPPEVLLRNAKHYNPSSDRNFNSWFKQAPAYKPISGSSRFSSSNRRGSRYGANPELRSYQLELPPEFPKEVLLRNAKNYYPTSDPNFNSWFKQAPVYKPISGNSRFSSSNRRGSRYAANPKLTSYKLELPPEFPPEVLSRKAKNIYSTAGENYDMYSWTPQAQVYKPTFPTPRYPSSYPSRYPSSYPSRYPSSYQSRYPSSYPSRYSSSHPPSGCRDYRYVPKRDLNEEGDIYEVQDKLIKQAEQLHARQEETHQLMMKYFDKEKQILRAATGTPKHADFDLTHNTPIIL